MAKIKSKPNKNVVLNTNIRRSKIALRNFKSKFDKVEHALRVVGNNGGKLPGQVMGNERLGATEFSISDGVGIYVLGKVDYLQKVGMRKVPFVVKKKY